MKLLYDIIIVFLPLIITLLLYFYYIDKKFTFKILVKLYIYGAVIAVPVVFFEQVLLSVIYFPLLFGKLYKALIVASFTEEFAKRYILLSLIYKDSYFIYKYSGIIFSLITALGFAFSENLLDIVFSYHSYDINDLRSIIALFGHIIFSLLMGYYLSLSKLVNSKRQKRYYFRLSLFVPILFHGIFDFLILVDAYVIALIFFTFLVFFFIYQLKKLTILHSLKLDKNKI